jgi:CRISPR/Cas system-associated protein Cas10 (large subunit of type III CRISPR-Cas system)
MNTKKSYVEKLKDPRWQKKRLGIMQRDDFKCQLCGDSSSTLHIHHKSYEKGKEPWDYDNNNLITYCEVCHKLVEYIKKLDTDTTALKVMKFKGTEYDTLDVITKSQDGSLFVMIYQYDQDGFSLKCCLSDVEIAALYKTINSFL